MSGNALRDNLFFKKQIAEKSAEMLGMLGVDEYLDLEMMEAGQDILDQIDNHWKDVEYQERWPHKHITLLVQKRIEQDCLLVKGQIFQLSKQPDQAQKIKPYQSFIHFQVRQEQALIDTYRFIFIKYQNKDCISQSFSKQFDVTEEKQLAKCILKINKLWQFEGIQARSAFFSFQNCELVISLKNSRFKCSLKLSETTIDQILFRLKNEILTHLMSNLNKKTQTGLTLNKGQSQANIKDKFESTSISQKIIIVYRLNTDYGLTVLIDKQNHISKQLLTKANQLTYRKSIYYLTKLCTSQQKYEPFILDIVECDEQSVEKVFQRLYQQIILSEEDINDFQTL